MADELAIPDNDNKIFARKFTATNRTIIIGALKRGNYLGDAAALAGIHTSTLRSWLAKGREDYDNEVESDWADFYTKILQAEASATDSALQRIESAAEKGFWKADAWRLERKNPEKWGPQSKVVVTDASHSSNNPLIHISDPREQMTAIMSLNGENGPDEKDFIDGEYEEVTPNNTAQNPRSGNPSGIVASGEIPMGGGNPLP